MTRLLSLLCFFLIGGSALAQTSPLEDPAHKPLRELRDDLLAGVNKGDIDAMLARMTPDIVITWQNGEVCRGPNQVRDFYKRMESSSKKTFQGYKEPPTADALTILYGGAGTASSGVVYGHSIGRYFLLGKEIDLPNRWTATVVKDGDRWLLAGYHVSMNVLDNPLLSAVKKTALVISALALVAGLALGFLIGRKKTADQSGKLC